MFAIHMMFHACFSPREFYASHIVVRILSACFMQVVSARVSTRLDAGVNMGVQGKLPISLRLPAVLPRACPDCSLS
jgi:hypothetical protein